MEKSRTLIAGIGLAGVLALALAVPASLEALASPPSNPPGSELSDAEYKTHRCDTLRKSEADMAATIDQERSKVAQLASKGSSAEQVSHAFTSPQRVENIAPRDTSIKVVRLGITVDGFTSKTGYNAQYTIREDQTLGDGVKDFRHSILQSMDAMIAGSPPGEQRSMQQARASIAAGVLPISEVRYAGPASALVAHSQRLANCTHSVAVGSMASAIPPLDKASRDVKAYYCGGAS